MKMTKFIACISILSLSFLLPAQAQYAFFPDQGIVTYEKTVHVKNLLKRHLTTLKEDDFSKEYLTQMMEKVPETAILEKKLMFNRNEMSLEPVTTDQPQIVSSLLQMGLLDYGAKIYQNLDKNESKMLMELGGSQIAIQDSLTDVKWKITDEYRNIAGYDCRRANGVTLDSVYVVAFYTDQLPSPVGPSTVHGLPGTILGLVVPEQHFNIYATKVEMTAAPVSSNLFKKRDDPMTRKETQQRMKEAVGRWMTDQQFNLMMAAILL